MPVTIRPSPEKVGRNTDPAGPLSTLGSKVFLSSYASIPDNDTSKICVYFEQMSGDVRNGFVLGIIRAFQQDLHLPLRPDDVWLAIITQFSAYVNINAEKLRHMFVAHEGRKELDLGWMAPAPHAVQMDKMARKMTCLIEEQLVDKEIRDWIIPDFTTTRDEDVAVASMVMMATMKEYFSYRGRTGCGFPSVTLLGEKSDWGKILARVEMLPKYGEGAAQWGKLLTPIIKRFVQTFDEPESEELKDFWLKTCYAKSNGSGKYPTYSGWITAFTYWDKKGLVEWHTGSSKRGQEPLVLDGTTYPIILQERVSGGMIEVPFLIKDEEKQQEWVTMIKAGFAGMRVSKGTTDKDGDTFQPQAGWWVIVKEKRDVRTGRPSEL